MPNDPLIEKDPHHILNHLDTNIVHWRMLKRRYQKQSGQPLKVEMCSHYIDAYQSVRTSLFGSTLPEDE